MLFNSSLFILAFLPAVLAGFVLVGRKWPDVAAALLGVVSLAFYASWSIRYLPLLLASICLNFMLSQLIGDGSRPRQRRTVFILAIAANLALLGYFKYANFFLATAADVTGAALPVWSIVLPLGISFYTFTQIAYLVDTYRNQVKERKFTHYLLFVTYFPHLIAGPILHQAEMMPQFRKTSIYRPTFENFSVGASIFIIGLAKKTLLADGIAPVAHAVFGAADFGQRIEFFRAWGGALAYAMQIYFDFSAYCDMAIGISILFNVRLPLNFNSPYKAVNIIDFWRRWHMTLSRFLRDYLYIPLGGSRCSRPRRYVNLIITMLLGGLWHGAAWTYVAWGGLHGFYLVINHAWQFVVEKSGFKPSPLVARLARPISIAVTFAAVVAAWVLFRASSFTSAMLILKGMAGMNGIDVPARLGPLKEFAAQWGLAPITQGPYISNTAIAGLLLLMAACWLMPNVYQLMGSSNPALGTVDATRAPEWRPGPAWAVGLGILGAIAFAGVVSGPPSEFLYFQF
jgi:D-alanyl-lipoteichoic acid acyltransferase DltB (MBOAT superfamily)